MKERERPLYFGIQEWSANYIALTFCWSTLVAWFFPKAMAMQPLHQITHQIQCQSREDNLDGSVKSFFFQVPVIRTCRNRLINWSPFWYCVAPRSLGYLRPRRSLLISSAACSSRTNFYFILRKNVRVCDRLRNRRMLLRTTSRFLSARTSRRPLSPDRPSQWAIYSDVTRRRMHRETLPNCATAKRARNTHFEAGRKSLYFGRVSSA